MAILRYVAEIRRQDTSTKLNAMTTVGLVGGLGPESTIDYYRGIMDAWHREDAGSAPHIVIDSLDVAVGLNLVQHDHPGLIQYLAESLERLKNAGADFIAITANTPHIVFDELVALSSVPLLSIVETCGAAAKRQGLRRVALLGTRFTMEAPFYPDVLARYDVEVIRPDAEDRAWIHDCYVNQLIKGEFRSDTRDEFIFVVRRLRDEYHVDGVILGGTELPLLLKATEIASIPLLDTTALHVAAIVERLRSETAKESA